MLPYKHLAHGSMGSIFIDIHTSFFIRTIHVQVFDVYLTTCGVDFYMAYVSIRFDGGNYFWIMSIKI